MKRVLVPVYTVPEADADLWECGRVYRESDPKLRPCAECGDEIAWMAPLKKRFCSSSCARRSANRQWREKNPERAREKARRARERRRRWEEEDRQWKEREAVEAAFRATDDRAHVDEHCRVPFCNARFRIESFSERLPPRWDHYGDGLCWLRDAHDGPHKAYVPRRGRETVVAVGAEPVDK